MASNGMQIIHFIPGRVRVKINRIKGNVLLAEETERAFSAVDGIHQTEASPLTGNVLICYDPSQPASIDAVVDISKDFGFFPDGLDVEHLKDRLRTYIAQGSVPFTLIGQIKSLFGNSNMNGSRRQTG
ncbi:MAG: hypothetical protein O7B35_11810 [Deltaproteobacteria bacterium]|nr:hypothetical protein [Deltaproteobacteria bacterium]